jgi:hypothetical protein
MGSKKCISVCSTLISLTLTILAFAFGWSILVDTKDASSGPENVWIWCLIYVIWCGIAIATIIVKAILSRIDDEETKKKSTPLDLVLALTMLGHFIWGMIIYNHLGSDPVYYRDYPTLWTLFMVYFWYNVAISCVIGILLSCLCLIKGCNSALDISFPITSGRRNIRTRHTTAPQPQQQPPQPSNDVVIDIPPAGVEPSAGNA